MLGGLSVESDGQPLTGPAVQRRRLALLAVLAAARDRGIRRERLIAYVWPESREERARQLLGQALHAFRRTFGDDAVLGGDELRLHPAMISCDAADFEDALDRGEPERAVRLWGGDFLDGFHIADAPQFESWLVAERARLRRRYQGAVQTLAVGAEERGDAETAVEWWRRLAALDPLDSRVALRLMDALVAAGNRSGALQHARVHETMIREELSAAPDPAVAAFVARLRQEPTPAAMSVSVGSDGRAVAAVGAGGAAQLSALEPLAAHTTPSAEAEPRPVGSHPEPASRPSSSRSWRSRRWRTRTGGVTRGSSRSEGSATTRDRTARRLAARSPTCSPRTSPAPPASR